MASQFESTAAAEFTRSFLTPFGQTVIRRIGGQADRTEDVEAIVEIDTEGGGLNASNTGQYTEVRGTLEVAADQANSGFDSWVIDGQVFTQVGEATGKDGGSQTITITRRMTRVAREPKARNR